MTHRQHRMARIAAIASFAMTIPIVASTQATADSVAASGETCFTVGGDRGDAALVNLTPVLARAIGFGQLVSSDSSTIGTVANVNFAPGTVDPNVAAAPIGADGKVCFVNSVGGDVHLTADHIGSITAAAYTPATAEGTASRKVDTRRAFGGARLAPNGRLCFGVPGSPGDAALVNLTPVGADSDGSGQLVSSSVTTVATVANVNFRPGVIDPNVAVAPIGPDGNVCFVNSERGSVDLVADHIGNIAGASYTPATPEGSALRLVDTRTATGGTRVAAGGRLCFSVAGSPGDAAVVNLTPVLAGGTAFGQLVSSDVVSPPVAANVNYRPGAVDPNVAVAPIGADGNVCFVNSIITSVDLVADHIGTISKAAYKPATATGAPSRRLDTRTTARRSDLVLAAASVGTARFGQNDDAVVEYVRTGLGVPIRDVRTSFPIRSGDIFENSNDEGFAFPFGRDVCFDNNLCLTFGGSTAAALSFVGWGQRDTLTGLETAPSRTIDEITIGSRWSDHLAVMNVDPGGCFSVGGGTTRGVGMYLQSSGALFGEFTPDGRYIATLPAPSDVTVLSLFAGDLITLLFADC